jgi:acyl-CoA synthetase (AMP-forming)/AMP-acid ligase II
MLTHQALLAMTLSYFSDINSVSEYDCMIHAAPMSHGSGLYSLQVLAKGANQVFPASSRFDVGEIFGLIEIYTGATFLFSPTMITRLIMNPGVAKLAAHHLKTVIYGGSPMYVEDFRRALNYFGPNLAQIYGQGESPMTITALSIGMHGCVEHPRY